MTRALIILIDGTTEIRDIKTDIPELCILVGGPIEYISVGNTAHLYCNEDAKLVEGWTQRINGRATSLIDSFNPGFADIDMIVGDVVILGEDVDGDEADVPHDIIARMMAAAP